MPTVDARNVRQLREHTGVRRKTAARALADRLPRPGADDAVEGWRHYLLRAERTGAETTMTDEEASALADALGVDEDLLTGELVWVWARPGRVGWGLVAHQVGWTDPEAARAARTVLGLSDWPEFTDESVQLTPVTRSRMRRRAEAEVPGWPCPDHLVVVDPDEEEFRALVRAEHVARGADRADDPADRAERAVDVDSALGLGRLAHVEWRRSRFLSGRDAAAAGVSRARARNLADAAAVVLRLIDRDTGMAGAA